MLQRVLQLVPALLVVMAFGAGSAWAQGDGASACTPGWVPTFGQLPGVSEGPIPSLVVRAVATYDDGHGAGPRVFVGGGFDRAGGVAANDIAAWDGETWAPVGGGVTGGGGIGDLLVFDDGSGNGPALYASGGFTELGGTPALRIARWDGEAWEQVGGGIGLPYIGGMTVFDDGAGPKLYVSASTVSDFVGNPHVYRLDGATLTLIGTGSGGGPFDMEGYDDGTGPALYVSGKFTELGGVSSNGLVKWDGSSWSAIEASHNGDGLSDLHASDVTGRSLLYAAGSFTQVGGVQANSVAVWDGAAWSPVGSGTSSKAFSLATFDDGSGPALYATGAFGFVGGAPAARIARWDGMSWSALPSGGLDDWGLELHAAPSGGPLGPALYVGGYFDAAGPGAALKVAAWTASGWKALGRGLVGGPRALAEFDDGSGGGPRLHVAGDIVSGGGSPLNHIAKWTGSGWSSLGVGIDGSVSDLEVFDAGSGAALYACGAFVTAGGVAAQRVARWNGTSWSSLAPGGPNAEPADLMVHDDGSGPALYMCGPFTAIGGVAMKGIARWNGTSWSAPGGGLNGSAYSLAIYDDGDGPALYVSGSFTIAGHTPASGIAKWTGSGFTALGSGLTVSPGSWASSMAVYDDGRGGALYVAGVGLTAAGGVPVSNVARWDGASWSALGSGLDDTVFDLAAYDDGDGSALFAAGYFEHAGGQPADGLARWDGTNWSAVEGAPAADKLLTYAPRVLAVLDVEGGRMPALVVGGTFPTAPGSGDSLLATLSGCADDGPWTDLGFALPGAGGAPQLVGQGSLVAWTPGSLTLQDAAPSSLALLALSVVGTPTPFKGGTLVPLPMLLSSQLVTSPAGTLPLAWSAWPAGASSLSLYFQFAIADGGAPFGVALSNALRADVP